MNQQPSAIEHAQRIFPRGLEQPEGSFRFSIDALLLASFTRVGGVRHMADLGTGCGVAGIALCLQHKGLRGIGIEIDTRLVQAAKQNVSVLGLEERFSIVHADVTAFRAQKHHSGYIPTRQAMTPETVAFEQQNNAKEQNNAYSINSNIKYNSALHTCHCNEHSNTLNINDIKEHNQTGSVEASPLHSPYGCAHHDYAGRFDCVIANPPYRLPQSGRPAATELRQQALFETTGTLEAFMAAASYLLRTGGRCSFIYTAGRLPDLLQTARMMQLEPKRLRMVHSRSKEPARLVLLEMIRGAQPDLRIEAPLILYEGQGEQTRLSIAALDFCPLLACNTKIQC